MADNVAVTSGSGTNIAADEVVDPTLGTVKAQYVKIMDGTLDSVNKLLIGSNGALSAMVATDGISSAGIVLTPKRAFANVAAGSTDTVLITAIASKKLRVLQVFASVGNVGTTLEFNSKPVGAGSAISPLINHDTFGGETMPFSPMGWFETNIGEGLSVTTGAGSSTGILVGYVEV